MSRVTIFEAIRAARSDKTFDVGEVLAIDGLLDQLGVPRDNERVTSAAGRKLITSFEGTRLAAYPDPATGGDPWTIGVGHTGPEVRKGLTITLAQADELLESDLRRFEAAVNRLAPKTTQAQFDALVSFAFNVGDAALAKSTLLKKHNAGDLDGAAAQFALWNKANGKVMAGLTRRRAAEARMYQGLPA